VSRLTSVSLAGKAALVLPFWVALLVSCRPALTEGECIKLLDHYTDKQVDQARPSTRPAERSVLIDQARLRAAADPEFATCTSQVSRSAYECAMAAGSADAIERCLL
jgi:hypothetical protein